MKSAPCAEPAVELSWRRMLGSTPVRNEAARATRNAEGAWEVSVPTIRPRWLVPPLTFVIKPSVRRSIVLDAMGGWLWEQCDGMRTVEEIIELFATRHRLTFHEGRVAVTGFLKDLIRRGALAVAVSNG